MVGGCIAKEMSVQAEQVTVAVEEVVISEEHDVEKAANATEKIHEAVSDQKTSTSTSTIASTSKRGTSDLDVEESRALLTKSWNLPSTKKLLILDVNGLLVARYAKFDRSLIPHRTPHAVVGQTYMFARPFCTSFLAFCLESFHVGIWSSMMEKNLRKALDFISPNQKNFLFVMHQGDCTNTGMRNPAKKQSPLFLKELARVWARFPTFSARDTLLIDDTPYKTLWNPPHTAIFPQAYEYDEGDEFLKGTLLEYLKEVRDAPDVQEFVRRNPFGEAALAPGCLHWDVYQMVLNRKKNAETKSSDVLTRLETLSLV